MLLKCGKGCFETEVAMQFDEVRKSHVIERCERFTTILVAVDVKNEDIDLIDFVLHPVKCLKGRFEDFRICSIFAPIQL